jgi:hypothetical protein
VTITPHDTSIWPGQPQLRLPVHRLMQVEPSGIVFSEQLNLEAWESVGRNLLSFTDSTSWWIADWLLYGESKFKDRYNEAIRRTSLNYQTLRNYTWVARRFELSRRRDGLSFGHHAEVAALELPEQDFWLRKAERFGWSRNQLRRAVRSSRQERLGAAEDADHPATTVATSVHLRLTADQFARCAAAAESAGVSVDSWAMRVLGAAVDAAEPWDG